MDPSLKAKQAWSKALECLKEARVLFSSHAAVQAAFGRHFVKTDVIPRRLHRLLLFAFESRQEADYELMALITLEEARERLAEAEEFIAGVRSLAEAGDGT